MSAISRDYRLRIYQEGSDSVVEFTFQQEIAEPPNVPGQTARPESGSVESVPWAVSLVDRNKAVSSTLGDSSSGRMTYHGRVADLSHRTNEGTWVVIATGRVSDVTEPQRGSYQVQVEDERMVERETDIFQVTDTMNLVPTGLLFPYGDVSAVSACTATVEWIQTLGGRDYISLVINCRVNSNTVLAHLINDLKADPIPALSGGANHDQGNFEATRIYVDGAEREILSFDFRFTPVPGLGPATEGWPGITWVESLKRMRSEDTGHRTIRLWIPVGDSDSGDNTWPTSPPSVGDEFTDCKIYPVGLRPSKNFPLHLGVGDAAHTYGTTDGKIHPFELLERLYTQAGVRFDATAMQALQDDPRYQPCEYRITKQPDNLAQWAEEHIYKPWQVLPFIGVDGELEPKSIALPGGDTFDPDALFEFTEHNMAGGGPTWHSPGREAKNVVIGSFKSEQRPPAGLVGWMISVTGGLPEGPADYIEEHEDEVEVEHDNVATVQRREHRVAFHGMHTRQEAEVLINRYARDLFSLYGDGPQQGKIQGLQDTISVVPGQWVKVTSSNAPNLAATSGRGGTRLALILNRGWSPAGPDFEILDAGADVQVLSTPTISSVVNGPRPEHSQTIAYTGLPGVGTTDWGYLEYAVSVGEPAATSPLWRLSKIIIGSASGSVTGYSLPSGSSIWWRLRAATPYRVRSSWSTAVNQTTASLSAPTGLSITNITARSADVSWTVGEDEYPVEVLVDSIPCEVLPEGSTETEVRGFEPSTDYTVQVRHIDPMEQPAGIARGASSLLGTTDNLTTIASANAWPAPHIVLVLPPGETGVPR